MNERRFSELEGAALGNLRTYLMRRTGNLLRVVLKGETRHGVGRWSLFPKRSVEIGAQESLGKKGIYIVGSRAVYSSSYALSHLFFAQACG
jgi:hypothetical protein